MSIFKQTVKSSLSVAQVDPGNYGGVLVAIVDLGTHSERYADGNTKDQRKVYLVWELPDNDKTVMGKMFSLTFGKKAKLREFVEGWRGKGLEDGEDFDVTKLLGRKCLVNVVANEKGYSQVQSVTALPKGMNVGEPSRKPVVWEIGQEAIDTAWMPWIFGKKVEDVIAACKELTGESTVPSNGAAKPMDEEEIPF